jgi:hypothetical protein
MDQFRNEYRRLVDTLVKELAALARELSANEVQAALAARAREEAKTPRVSPRLARALERAEERRKLAAERRAAALAARSVARSRRGSAHAGDAQGARRETAAAPHSPPPLFVHKRSRDGSIQKLERAQAEAQRESAPPPPA